MSRKVFLIGNGESRKDFPLELLRGHGKIYGCNAIYRDYSNLIDVLTAVDNGIIHEIYHSGFATKRPCYFRNWTKLPKMMYDQVIEGFANAQDLDQLKDYDFIIENKEDKDQAEEFVVHGTSLAGMVSILKKTQKENPNASKEIIQKQINKSSIYISWIKKNDMSFDLKDSWSDYKDHGWACGASSGFIAVKKEQPTEVYLIGHDLVSNTKQVNNIYKDTKHYQINNASATPHINWINQWYTLMDWNPKIKFYKVNKNSADSGENTDQPIHEWSKWLKDERLEYITQAQVLDRLSQI